MTRNQGAARRPAYSAYSECTKAKGERDLRVDSELTSGMESEDARVPKVPTVRRRCCAPRQASSWKPLVVPPSFVEITVVAPIVGHAFKLSFQFT